MMDNPVIQYDLKELSKYFTPRMIIKKKGGGKKTGVYNVKLRRCKIEDFYERKVELPEYLVPSYEGRICPDFEDIQD